MTNGKNAKYSDEKINEAYKLVHIIKKFKGVIKELDKSTYRSLVFRHIEDTMNNLRRHIRKYEDNERNKEKQKDKKIDTLNLEIDKERQNLKDKQIDTINLDDTIDLEIASTSIDDIDLSLDEWSNIDWKKFPLYNLIEEPFINSSIDFTINNL